MEKPENITENDWKLLKAKYKNLKQVVKKLNQDYPVQYLIGNVNFYGYIINVNKNVLIPRFETETLVEKTIKYINKLNLDSSSVLELGTGSGCISIVLKKELPNLNITAIDNSIKALKVAKKNAKNNKADVYFFKQDLFKYKSINKYNILISNPPYITSSDVVSPSIKYEPKKAIYADETGINYYKHIIKEYKKYLNKKSLIALEIGDKESKEIEEYAKKYYPNSKIKIEKDLNKKNRYIFIINE